MNWVRIVETMNGKCMVCGMKRFVSGERCMMCGMGIKKVIAFEDFAFCCIKCKTHFRKIYHALTPRERKDIEKIESLI